MKWVRFTIETTIEAVDILSYELDAIGIEGIEIEDHQPLSDEDRQSMFVDIIDDPEVIDEIARVSFYLDSEACDPEKTVRQVMEILDEMKSYTDVGAGTVDVSETEDKDWINNWKEFFKPFRASERIAICPTWIDPEEMDPDLLKDNPQLLRIDPGIAFGTGAHETTKLCIQALDRLVKPGDRVLDVGCGSGILSIAALLLGAAYTTAVDIDPQAVLAARDNFNENSIDPSTYNLFRANLLEEKEPVSKLREEPFDIVVANILPDVIVPLTPLIPGLLKSGGLYITSGILKERADEVRNALNQSSFSEITLLPMKDWVAFTAIR